MIFKLMDLDIEKLITQDRTPLLFAGVYDLLSASVAKRYADGLFVSGAGLSTAKLGLPDMGFLSSRDVIDFVAQLTTVLPDQIVLIDIDDGFGDPRVSAQCVLQLARLKASGVVVEDQGRPRRFGHLPGGKVVALEQHLAKLEAIRRAAPSTFIVSRTDAREPEEIIRRVEAFVEVGVEGVLVAGLDDLALIRRVREVRNLKYLVFDRVQQPGRSPVTRKELRALGVDICISSTASIDAACSAMINAFRRLSAEWGNPLNEDSTIGDSSWLALMYENIGIPFPMSTIPDKPEGIHQDE